MEILNFKDNTRYRVFTIVIYLFYDNAFLQGILQPAIIIMNINNDYGTNNKCQI